MSVGIILASSLLLQFVAILLALRLIRITGWRTAWSCVAAAIALMAVRRGLTFLELIRGEFPTRLDPITESVALGISVLMVVGLYKVAPSFIASKRSIEALRDAEAFSESLIETANVMVVALDVNGSVTRINRAGEEITGYTDAELRGRNWFEVIVPKSRYPSVWHEFTRLMEGGLPKTFQNPILTKSGEERYIQWRTNEVKMGGEIVGTILFGMDTTELQRAAIAVRESEANFRALFEQAGVGVAQIETKTGRFAKVNKRYCQIVGYSEEEMLGLTFLDITHPSDLRQDLDNMARVHRGEIREFSMEKRYVRKDGAIVWVELTVSAPWQFGGTPVFHTAVVQDITTRKLAEESLRESERTFKTLIDNLPGVVYRCRNDKDWTVLFISDGSLALSGYSVQDYLSGRVGFGQLIHPDDHEGVWTEVQAALRERRPFQLVYRLRTAAGDEKWVREQGRGVYSESGELIFLEGFANDITPLKRAERLLEERQHFLERILDTEPGTVYIFDLAERRNVYINRHWLTAYGYSPEETHGMGSEVIERIFHRDDLERIRAHHDAWRDAADGETRTIEFRMVTKSGSERWLQSREAPFARDDRGHVSQILGIAHDITDRKAADEQIREWRDRYDAAIRASGHVLYDWSAGTNEVKYGGSLEETLGYTVSDMDGGVSRWIEIVHPEDRPAFIAEMERSVAQRTAFGLEYRVRHRDGRYISVLDTGYPVIGVGGEQLRQVGLIKDITDRKAAEVALREREQILRLFVDHSPAAIAMFDRDMRYVVVSRRWMTDFGLGEQNLVGRSHYEVFPDIPERWKAVHRRCLAGAIEQCDEDPFTRADGHTDWVRWEVYPWRKAAGEIGGIIIFTEVITDRKLAEEALEESEQRYASLVADLPGVVYRCKCDPDWTATFVSDGCLDLMGYTSDEIVNNKVVSLGSLIHPDDRGWVWEKCGKNLDAKKLCRNEYRIIAKDGTIKWVWDQAHGVFSPSGELLAVEGVYTDITERKEAETALSEAELRLRLALETGRIGTWDWNMLSGEIVWSRSHVELWGLAPGAFKGTYEEFDSSVHPDDRDGVRKAVAKARREHRPFRHEFRIVWPDGTVHWIDGQGEMFFDDTGAPVRMLGVSMDISERKQAESERERLLHVLDVSLNELYLFDAESLRFEYVNRGAQRNLGYSMAQLRAMTPIDLKPEFTEASFRAMIEPMRSGQKDTHVFETVHLRADGTRYPVQVHLQFIEVGDRRVFLAVILDITERKRSEERLHAHELHIQTLVANVPGAVYRCGNAPNWIIEFISDPVEQMSGYPASDFVNDAVRTFVSIIEPEDWPEVERVTQECLSRKVPFEVEYRIRHANGGYRWIYDKGQGVFDASGALRWLDGVIVDITERKRAAAALADHSERLQRLTQRLVQAQEDEARRIGRELHDELGQILTSLKIKLQTLPRRKEAKSFDERVSDLTMTVDQAIDRIRTISADLRPTVLDDLGLAAALRWMLDRQTQQAGLKGTFSSRGLGRLSPELETTCYRVAQEALTNVLRHAHAKRVRIELRREERELHLAVSDDGKGFDVDMRLSGAAGVHNLGLLGMKERVELMGGRFVIRSTHGQGTEVHAWFALTGAEIEAPEPWGME